MKLLQCTVLLLTTALISPLSLAHKRWLMPTDFSLSDTETVTVDFTASNNLFFVDKGMPLAPVQITSPDGAVVPLLNPQEGERRSSFDFMATDTGTYRISADGAPVYFVSYQLPGQSEVVHARGPLAKLKAELPSAATDIVFFESHGLIETFVTLGTESMSPSSKKTSGLRLQLLGSHPNVLYTDEPARFGFQLDGNPVSGMSVQVQAEGSRYRDIQDTREYTTNQNGVVEIAWPTAGRYLIEAGLEQDVVAGEISTRYFSYFLTVEVLAP
jgi:uncharacterized GH25 family protein